MYIYIYIYMYVHIYIYVCNYTCMYLGGNDVAQHTTSNFKNLLDECIGELRMSGHSGNSRCSFPRVVILDVLNTKSPHIGMWHNQRVLANGTTCTTNLDITMMVQWSYQWCCTLDVVNAAHRCLGGDVVFYCVVVVWLHAHDVHTWCIWVRSCVHVSLTNFIRSRLPWALRRPSTTTMSDDTSAPVEACNRVAFRNMLQWGARTYTTHSHTHTYFHNTTRWCSQMVKLSAWCSEIADKLSGWCSEIIRMVLRNCQDATTEPTFNISLIT